MEAKYPQARFKFRDAAIGGTGSQLGVFRLDRDVLARRPDLVFLDFSANDDIYSGNRETLASYEAIVHRLLSEARCPVVQVIFPFEWDVARKTTDGMKRRDAHLAISRAYNTPVGDAIALAIERVGKGETSLERLWPIDGVHPGDKGYVLFADAAWAALQGAVSRGQVCRVAEPMLYGDAYLKSVRMPLAKLGPLPAGWKAGKPNVTAAYFDFLMSRWIDSETIACRPPAGQGSAGQGAGAVSGPVPRQHGDVLRRDDEDVGQVPRADRRPDGAVPAAEVDADARSVRCGPVCPASGRQRPPCPSDRHRPGPGPDTYPGD